MVGVYCGVAEPSGTPQYDHLQDDISEVWEDFAMLGCDKEVYERSSATDAIEGTLSRILSSGPKKIIIPSGEEYRQMVNAEDPGTTAAGQTVVLPI